MSETLFWKTFRQKKPIIGMIHVFQDQYDNQLNQALKDLDILQPFIDGVIVENYGWGYVNANLATDDAVELLTKITYEVVKKAKIPVGINLLPNDYEKSLCIAPGHRGAIYPGRPYYWRFCRLSVG